MGGVPSHLAAALMNFAAISMRLVSALLSLDRSLRTCSCAATALNISWLLSHSTYFCVSLGRVYGGGAAPVWGPASAGWGSSVGVSVGCCVGGGWSACWPSISMGACVVPDGPATSCGGGAGVMFSVCCLTLRSGRGTGSSPGGSIGASGSSAAIVVACCELILRGGNVGGGREICSGESPLLVLWMMIISVSWMLGISVLHVIDGVG